MKLSIVIVNWNSGVQLAEAVASIARFHHDLVSSVVIVDNASVDDSLEFLSSLSNNPFSLQLVLNTENLGFGKACNLGAFRSDSEYVLFLNPDASIYADTLPKILVFMQQSSNASVGICGVQLLNDSGHISRTCARFPSPLGLVVRAIGVDRIFPRLGQTMREWDHTQNRVVDQVIGAFFLVRRELFDALAGFDERFFVYFEEVDFSYRAHQLGWHSVYLADAHAFHSGGGTSNQVKARRLFYSLRSRLQYSFKHFPWLGALGVLLATLFLEPVSRSVLAVFLRSWSGLKETWVAFGMLWQDLTGILRNSSQ